MKLSKTIFIAFVLGFSLHSQSVKAEPEPWIVASIGFSIYLANNPDLDPWYAYWSIGYGDIDYPHSWDDLESFMDEADSMPGIYRSHISMDIFGFYWPVVDQKTMLGFVINGVSDWLVTDNYQEIYFFGEFIYFDDIITIDTFSYGLSMMRFFGTELGDGLLLRGDIGLAEYRITYKYGGSEIRETSDMGLGYLVGIGYGIPVFSNSHLLFSFNYSNRHIEGDDFKNYIFSVGIMW